MFKSFDNLQTHDQKFHIEKKGKKENKYKCDQCISTFARKIKVLPHINESHTKFYICEHIFTNITLLQTHMKAIHNKELIKHKLEREPGLKNHKIKKISIYNRKRKHNKYILSVNFYRLVPIAA